MNAPDASKKRGQDRSVLRSAVTSNLLLVSLFAVVLTAFAAELQRSALEQQLELRAAALTDFLAAQGQFGMLVSDHERLSQLARNALSVSDVLSVEWIGNEGQSILRVSNPGAQGGPVVISRDVLRPTAGGLVDWESHDTNAGRLGSVRVAFSTERQQRLLWQNIRYGVEIVLACLIVILAAQYYQLRGLLRPLQTLIGFTVEAGKGNLKQRAPIARMDEIGRLAAAFNQMLDKLSTTTMSRDDVNNILRSMAETVIVLDAERKIRTVNTAALHMLGYTEDELIGQPASIVTGCGLRTHTAVRGAECTFRLKNGHEIPVLFSAALLHTGSDFGGEVWLAQDISARKRADEQLRAAKQEAETASQAKSELLSRTSHELRTPLNAILGFAQLLEMSELNELDRANLDHILRAGRHLLKLINEVLDISGIESGRRGLSVEPVYVRDAVAESVELVAPLAARRNVVIHDSAKGDRVVLADRQRLQQVIINLLSNAVKYNRENGHVFIDCVTGPEGFHRISIRDTGKGITEEGLKKLFTPFERLGAEQADIEGTGLGLTFAKAFIESMGGKIGVTSLEGVGSTFWIDLPPGRMQAIPAPDRVEAPAPAVQDDSTRRRVLYIEDNSSNRQLIERTLQFRPLIELITATNGADGLSAAMRNQPDLILLDLHLPDLWGDEVLRRLKRDPSTAPIPVIVLSADATPKQIESLLSLGAAAYLTKPIDIRQILATLDEKLSERPVAC